MQAKMKRSEREVLIVRMKKGKSQEHEDAEGEDVDPTTKGQKIGDGESI